MSSRGRRLSFCEIEFRRAEMAIRLVVLLRFIGFPVALVFTRTFEPTPEGIKRPEDVDRSQSITHRTGRRLDFLIIALLLLVIGVFS
jgi:hypothetical protein